MGILGLFDVVAEQSPASGTGHGRKIPATTAPKLMTKHRTCDASKDRSTPTGTARHADAPH
jgi:hypothetical protein